MSCLPDFDELILGCEENTLVSVFKILGAFAYVGLFWSSQKEIGGAPQEKEMDMTLKKRGEIQIGRDQLSESLIVFQII